MGVLEQFSSTGEEVALETRAVAAYRESYPGLHRSPLEAALREYARYVSVATVFNSTPRGIATGATAGLTAIQAARCGVRGAATLTGVLRL